MDDKNKKPDEHVLPYRLRVTLVLLSILVLVMILKVYLKRIPLIHL